MAESWTRVGLENSKGQVAFENIFYGGQGGPTRAKLGICGVELRLERERHPGYLLFIFVLLLPVYSGSSFSSRWTLTC